MVHCALLSLISIPHKLHCSGRLSKLKYQAFVWKHFLTHYHTKDYESWKKQGDQWWVGEGGTRIFRQEGGREFFLIGKCGDKNHKINEVRELKVNVVPEDTLSTFSSLVSYENKPVCARLFALPFPFSWFSNHSADFSHTWARGGGFLNEFISPLLIK